ncbi:MAG: alpha/beta hydrolase [Actinomycetota bacterium]
MDDLAGTVLNKLVPGGVQRGELRRGHRLLRWVEAGSGEPTVILDAGLAEPGSLVWAGVLPALSARTRVIAYDRAGIGASDPVSPLTLDGELDDLAALAGAGAGHSVLVGHSWGRPAGPARRVPPPGTGGGAGAGRPDPRGRAGGSPLRLRAMMAVRGQGAQLLHTLGQLDRMVRGAFRPFAQQLTSIPGLQAQILDAYAACYTGRAQARMLRDENRLSMTSVPQARQIRAGAALPDVPITVISATKGLPDAIRDRWTAVQAGLADSVAGGEHIVAQATGHAIQQERPELVTNAVIRVLDHVRQP